MSLTAALWVVIAVAAVVLSLQRPVWAVAFYMQTFFAAPHLWWWGRDIPSARYSLWSGFLLAAAVLFSVAQASTSDAARKSKIQTVALFMALNATFVHVFLAVNNFESLETLTEVFKFSLLSFLIARAIKDRKDFRIATLAIALGAAYIGWECTINGRGDFSGSRLEGVGAPGAENANSLASVMLTTLPLTGSLLVDGSVWVRLAALGAAPFALNVLLMCNSRGAFIGLIAGALAFVFIAKGRTRKQAIRAVALGAVVLYMLLGDPKILDRFMTTFAGSEDRDRSAASRLDFWRAGMLMLEDYPLGAGGGAFKYSLGLRYLTRVVGDDAEERSLHNGYLTEATDWGIQGLILKLFFVGLAITAANRTSTRCRHEGRLKDALVGICIIASATAVLIHSFFGSFLGNEWIYWVVGLLLAYSRVYQVAEVEVTDTAGAFVRSGPQPQAA